MSDMTNTFTLDGEDDSLRARARPSCEAASARRRLHPAPVLPPGIQAARHLQAVHGQGRTAARRVLHHAGAGRHGGRERHAGAQRQAPHAAADAVRRGQPFLSVLREERQLPAAGDRLRPGHADAALRPLLPGPRRSTPRIRTCCSTSTAASCASCACAPAATSTARTCSPSAGAASRTHLIVNSPSRAGWPTPTSPLTDRAAQRLPGRRDPAQARRLRRADRRAHSTTSSRSASVRRDAPRTPEQSDDAAARSKLRVATASLAGCFGCHMSLLDIDERLLELLELVEFDRSPLTDIKHCGPCDIGLIEGGVCNAENVHVLREFRSQLQDPGRGRRLRHQRRPAGAAQPPRPRRSAWRRSTSPSTGVANGA